MKLNNRFPTRFKNCTLEQEGEGAFIPHDETQEVVLKLANRLAADPESIDAGFYLYGATGVGKSHIMYALAKALAQHDSEEHIFFSKNKHSRRTTHDSIHNKFSELSEIGAAYKFIFPDDLELGELGNLEPLFLEAWDYNHKVFIASNYTLDEHINDLSTYTFNPPRKDRFLSRFKSNFIDSEGNNHVYTVEGPDHRLAHLI
jgi:predicted ATPase